MDEGLGNALASLRMSQEANSHGDILSGEDALVVVVGDIPDLCEDRSGELRAAEYLDGSIAGDDTDLLQVCLGEYLVYEGHLLRRGGKL